ncbi:MAG: hypothetical protein ACRDZU_17250 [Acidimicrobiales bacterium]
MTVESLLAKASEGMHAGRSFGPVIDGDGCLIVPVALAVGGGGGGEGPSEGGTGSGGGFGTVSWPLGVYVVKDGRARWVPALDATRLALGALALVRAIIRLRARRAAKAS